MLAVAPSSGFSIALANEQATQRLAVDIAAVLEARRPGHAVGRPRRRQDHLRARPDPPSRRRPAHRGAEPDLHADADLRAAALPVVHADLYRVAQRGRARRARLRRPAGGRRGAAGMAGPRRRMPAGRPARHRVHARAAARRRTQRNARSPATARSRRALERIGGDRASSSRRAAWRDAQRVACRATPRPAPTSGSSHERRKRDPDERAAPAGRPAGARRQALQRDRASRRGREAVRRDGAARCASAASRRRRSMPPTSTRACCSSRISAPSRSSRAIRRRRSRSATRPRSTCWSSCTASTLPARCRSRRSVEHRLPPYDIDAFLIEAELLLDWYLPHRGADARRARRARVRRAVARGAEPTLTTRRRPGCCATFIRRT